MIFHFVYVIFLSNETNELVVLGVGLVDRSRLQILDRSGPSVTIILCLAGKDDIALASLLRLILFM